MYGHLLRRTLEAASEHLSSEKTGDWQALHDRYQMPVWGTVLIGITTVAFILLDVSLEYTLRLIINLAIVETPATTVVKVYETIVDQDMKKDEVVDVEVETEVVSEKPVTSSIKRTLKHIKNIGGRTAYWRGLHIWLVYALIVMVFHMIAAPMRGHAGLSTIVSPFIADMAAALLTARIHCAWTHATITSGYRKYRERVINRVQWKQLLPVTALKVVGQHFFTIAVMASAGVCGALMERQTSNLGRAATALIPISVALFTWLFVVLPVGMMVVRKEASMLDESEETIVPFDRTFGNRIIPGLNTLKLRDNWTSISRDTWYRVVMLHIKFVGIVALVGLVYFHVVLLEMWAIMGDALPSLLRSAMAQLQNMG